MPAEAPRSKRQSFDRERRLLDRARAKAAGPTPIATVEPDQLVPVSPLQRRLWFLQQAYPNEAIYQTGLCYRTSGDVDPHQLAAAVELLCQRHEALASRIELDQDGAPHLRLVSAGTEVPVVTGVADPMATVCEFFATPFDLARERPARAMVVPTGRDSCLLAISLHHIAYDGRSLALLHNDLQLCFSHLAQGQPLPPRDGPDYRAYARWMTDRLESEEVRSQLSYWISELAGLPLTTDLPRDRPRRAVADFAGGFVDLHVPVDVAQRVRELAVRRGCSVFVLLLSGYACLLHRLSADSAVAVGTPVSTRQPELNSVVGLFVNTVTVRTDVTASTTFSEVVTMVAMKLAKALDHSEVPFEDVVAQLQLPRTLRYNPVFQTMFQYTPGPAPTLRLPGLRCERVEIEPPNTVMDLEFYATDGPDGSIQGWVSFSRCLFDERSAQILAVSYTSLLCSLTSAPDLPVAAARVLVEPGT
jgi:hypothetical protein